ncbi:hypothetical protein ACQ4PT_009348 [Festuca glaucescens]
MGAHACIRGVKHGGGQAAAGEVEVIQYADDTLLLLRADSSQLRRARWILESFSRATGLAINFAKSAFVPIHVPEEGTRSLAAIFGCPLASFPQKYLGLPLTAMKLHVRDLDHLVVKLEKRAPGWKGSLLPSGGHLVLIDAVLSALPSHAMFVILLHGTTVEHADRPHRTMLWKDGLNALVMTTKSPGVTPWTRWVRRWYGDFGIAQAPSALDTPIWRTFKKVFALYCHLTVVAAGSGATVSFWLDNWHKAGPLFACLPALFSHCTQPEVTIANALRPADLSLQLQPRLTVVATAELAVITAVLRELRLTGGADVRTLPGSGTFRSSDVYKLLLISGVSLPLNDVNWDNFAPTKVRIFFWIARHGNTRTRAFLYRLCCLPTVACPFCSAPEDLQHLLFSYPRLGPLRAALGVPVAAVADDLDGICEVVGAQTTHLPPTARHTLILLILWIV